jgi:hypothetical protein
MSDPFVHDDNLVAAARRLNWDHARHVETQRLLRLAVYSAISVALGFVSIHPGDPFLRLGAPVLGLCITPIVWAITHKLGLAFANQIRLADRCANRLAIQALDGTNEYIPLHGYVGFPRKPPQFAGKLLTVRLMFDVFYGTLAAGWLILLGYLMFHLLVPPPVL